MNALRRISVTAALVAALFSIPALAQKVVTDYDHSVNFSRYHTYSWGHVQATDPLFESRIREAVDHVLQAKGWQLVPAESDVMLTAVAIKGNQTEYTTFYDGLGGGWRWHGWGTGMATTTVDKIPVGTLVLDIYDSSTKNLVWRGEAHDQLSDKPDKDTKKLEKAVDKMFAKFPPQAT
ncbi:DUF4136 domain-containing protein [Edaphobacter sp. HDX4]|uniref:DUF4136 domain-containing protein n=1 Tax=Edaphobacter sp. HDX4 TaxID=2794064 RepID=UPI002FE6A6E9